MEKMVVLVVTSSFDVSREIDPGRGEREKERK
jgi:hypothetical protein